MYALMSQNISIKASVLVLNELLNFYERLFFVVKNCKVRLWLKDMYLFNEGVCFLPVTDEMKSMKLQNVPDVIDVTSHKKRPLSTRDPLNQSSNTRYGNLVRSRILLSEQTNLELLSLQSNIPK